MSQELNAPRPAERSALVGAAEQRFDGGNDAAALRWRWPDTGWKA